MNDVLNISAYRFVALPDAAGWRSRIEAEAGRLRLLGTVLLATEGINLFLAGAPPAVREFMQWLRADPRFAGLQTKDSVCARAPFRKLVVKLKPEIIRMNHPTIRPQEARAPAVDAATLARWLDRGADDAGRDVVLLDTRNGFEVDQGRFDGALDWRLGKFSDFPAALRANEAQLRGKTVVSYCTGGIRCEKAALLMADAGLEHAFQLDGGILKYFEDTDGRHFAGRCFVFDERASLDAALSPPQAV